MAESSSRALAPENNPKYGVELPQKYLAGEILWNDDDFMPQGGNIQYREEFRKIYSRYFRQIVQDDGFEIDVYPGNAKAAIYVPYLDFETEADMLTKLANHAIEEFNKSSSAYKYKFLYIEKVNYIMTKYCEYLITVKVANLTLRTPMATFQIRAYKGPNAESIITLCRRKGEDVKAVNEVCSKMAVSKLDED